jgi:hypothetical protein
LETDSGQSMTAWSINVGSKLAQGVSKIYTNLFSGGSPHSPSMSRTQHSPTSSGGAGGQSQSAGVGSVGPQKGIVTVLDLLAVPDAEGDELPLTDRLDGVIAHFIAHNKVKENNYCSVCRWRL